jgi:hypothetical protein
MEEQEQKLSKFSGAINILIRLNNLWTDSHNHSRAGLFKRWNSDLDRIWIELVGDLSVKIFEDKKKEFDSFDDKLFKLGEFQDHINDGFECITKDQIEKRNKQYKILMEKELFLKRIENEFGKGTKWDDGDEDDFD